MSSSQRALRRLIGEIAEHDPEDVVAILTALDPPARARAQALVDEFLGSDGQVAVPSVPAVDPICAGVSPWLAERLAPSLPAGMTPAAHAALRACAAGMSSASDARTAFGGQSLGSRILGLLTRRRAFA